MVLAESFQSRLSDLESELDSLTSEAEWAIGQGWDGQGEGGEEEHQEAMCGQEEGGVIKSTSIGSIKVLKSRSVSPKAKRSSHQAPTPEGPHPRRALRPQAHRLLRPRPRRRRRVRHVQRGQEGLYQVNLKN